ncbi:type VI secretion system baseplate subunit TssG [Chitinibacter sp. GC72]|uniref:type VI secretion system baseplate subunit TssG n=1 Tax=Chitinibacter sp. GC72 TaxID=1526917 RepID=UPI0012F73F39|nr:type VI secretion system baseplate subunit TssG [Chitinibacter sp. GC72]
MIHSLIRDSAQRQNLFAVMRWVDANNPDKPLLGRSQRTHEDAVRLAHQPDMAFAATEISAIEIHPVMGVPVIRHFSNGLFGPNGPLPLHLTEQVWDKLHNHADRRLRDFADIFHHRMQCLLYRAWADVQPVIALDRDDNQLFAARVAAIAGYAGEELEGRDALPDYFKIRHAGQFCRNVRSTHELQVLLRQLLNIPVKLTENCFQFLHLDAEQYTALGKSNSNLGQSMVLGKRVPDVQFGFSILLGPMLQSEYDQLDPESISLQRINSLVRNWIGLHYNWRIQLEVLTTTARKFKLGQGVRLGFDSWLLPKTDCKAALSGITYAN